MTKENSSSMKLALENAPDRFDRSSVTPIASRSDIREVVTPTRDLKPAFDVYIVIDRRTMERACFVQCLTNQCKGSVVRGYGTVEEWQEEFGSADVRQVILANLGSSELSNDDVQSELRSIVAQTNGVPVVALGAAQDIEACIAALDCGASGYIPPCIEFEDIVEAIWLAVSGGVFLPRTSLLAMRKVTTDTVAGRANALEEFTDRQVAVADALRCGSANKTIAYELSLRESTVKVHVRNIFQKLKATNRTEAAVLLNQMTGWPEKSSSADVRTASKAHACHAGMTASRTTGQSARI
ncbi:DNA-binding response regulator, NarL/FixJ family, contains REC and HTH domains [Jannaschia faecimaris]|uniref:DNA-binding response regulator, NarL/FixJ family, contains REC and HTH domains n=1 Tax=Jannaschia faecimaris TaxID=1244108 RepID=A0A1H3JDX0_9RHOB|nr:response regulator transcription factor [Jannaschia faecimaris]SDY37394.1 DNA-binding response regulator, NarL/FixJ family, contains REC and HTH domains [Jannaschia faecimaris]